jgi:serine/threonine-protein kinase
MADRAPGANVPAEIDALVTRLLAKDAGARFADAKELIDALDAIAAQLAARGRIADAPRSVSRHQSTPRASSHRLDPLVADGASSIALGPTRLAERVPVLAVSRILSVARRSLVLAKKTVPPWAKSRRAALFGTALAAITLVVIVVTYGGQGSHAPASVVATSAEPPERPPDPKWDNIVASAQATLERGDYATAIEALVAVEKKESDRPDVHMLLERAYTGVRNSREAMREAGLWLVTDAKAAADLKLQEDVRNAALVKDTQDEAFALLEEKMGTRGIDILYDVAYGASGRLYPQAAARAKRSLEFEDIRARASPALAVLLDFRDARTCDEKHALLERARDQGDARLLSTLQPYLASHGCGFLGRSDCYPCMHRDRLLDDARSAIEERATRPTQ